MTKDDKLLTEVNQERKNIKTDSYSMSIGEIINLYKDGELELDPAYQRLFRWSDEQKSKFIESLLLGIPIPPIFVAQKEGGKWSVVDGVQRISTLLQLTGDLENKEILRLTTTKKLPSLENYTWNNLPDDVKRILKRTKLGINIILTENSIQAQYELFQRLNTGALHLEPQEIRNCLIIMLSSDFYDKLDALKDYEHFIGCLQLQDEKFEIEFHTELALRYFIAKYGKVDYASYKASTTLLSDFLDEETARIIEDKDFNFDSEIEVFKRTFKLINSALGKHAFKKYNVEKDDFEGQFLQSSFEAIAPGVGDHIDKLEQIDINKFKQLIKTIYSQSDYLKFSSRGTKALTRFKGLTEFSKIYFNI